MSVADEWITPQLVHEGCDLKNVVVYQRHVRLVDVANACGHRESRYLQPLMTQLGVASRRLPGTTGKWLNVVDAQRLVTASQQTTSPDPSASRVPLPRTVQHESVSEVVQERIEARRIRVSAYLLRHVAIIDIARVEGVGRRTVTRDVLAIRQEWDIFRALGHDAIREAQRVADDLGIGPLVWGYRPFRAELLAACFTIAEGRQRIEDIAHEIVQLQGQP